MLQGGPHACRQVYAHEPDEFLQADVIKADVVLKAEEAGEHICRVA